MKVLLTGSTGFIGKIILEKLSLHNTVVTIGRRDCNFTYDFNDIKYDIPKADLLIHSAGLAHYNPKDRDNKKEFSKVNVEYSKNLLRSISESKSEIKYLVLISSVSVYGLENGYLVNETERLNAKDPYGISKVMCENEFIKWSNENNVLLTILRLPLVVGPSAPGNLGNMIRAIRKGYYFNIGHATARKSMVLASDVANHIVKAAKVGGIYNLTDGHHPSIYDISNNIARQLGRAKVLRIPLLIARLIAVCGDLIGNKAPLNSVKLRKITYSLTFDDSLARKNFGWSPAPVLKTFKINDRKE